MEILALRAPPVLAATVSVTPLALVEATVIQLGTVRPNPHEPELIVTVTLPPAATAAAPSNSAGMENSPRAWC